MPPKEKSPPSLIGGTETRAKWGNKLQFILSCVGYSVGLGNVWRFSYLVYENGGGAFLIPYFMAVAMCGLPLYALELAIGQYGSLGPTTAFRRMGPLFQGIGWGTVCVSYNVATYYNVIIAWILYYLFESFRSKLLWEGCDHPWNTHMCGSRMEDKQCEGMNGTELADPGARWFGGRCYNSSMVADVSLDCKILEGTTIMINGTINNTIHHLKRMSPAEEFFQRYILNKPDGDFDNLGGMNWPLVGCFALAWTLVFACLVGGIETSGKVVYFTAIFPYVVLLIMLFRGALSAGSGKGVEFYIWPQMEKLVDPNVWRKAAVQVFYSLGQGQGGLTTLASYNQFDNNFIRDGLVVSLIDSFTSTFAGFTTFSIIGYVAHFLEVEIKDAVKSGPGLTFIVYPQAIAEMPGKQFWSVLFFTMLISLGLGTEMVLYGTATTAIIDQFPSLAKRKTWVIGLGCIFSFLVGLPFCTRNGITVFTVYDDYSSGYVVMLVALYETVFVCWVYGLGRFMKDIQRMRGKMPNYYWRVTWAVLTPLYMLIIFLATIIMYEPSKVSIGREKPLPYGAQQLGWFLSSMPMVAMLTFAIFRISEVLVKRLPWPSLITPTPHWCPAADLVKRSPARHEGSARLHLLDRPYHPHRPHDGETSLTSSSKLKSGEGSGSKSVPSTGLGL